MSRSKKPAHVLERIAQPEVAVKKKDGRANNGRKPGQKMGRYVTASRERLASGTIITKTMSEVKWRRVLEMTASGLARPDVIKGAGTTREIFDAYLIANVGANKQLRDAQLVWIRRSWPTEELEAMFCSMMLGNTVKASGAKCGYDEQRIASFYELVLSDKAIRERYDAARVLQAESWLDDNIDIADNRGDDTFVDLKGVRKTDRGIIQRDNLRIQTRQWTMSAMNRKRFGDHRHVDHGGEIAVNHAVLLAGARKRLEKLKQPPAIVDNETQQVVNQ